MGWTLAEARRLLSTAWPWGAHVTVQSGSEFVAVRYEVLAQDFGDDRALLRFERDPGDTLQEVTRDQLEGASRTGVLDLPGGGRVRRPEVDDMDLLAFPFRDFIGPQSRSDSRWTARLRLHQSWWRAFRLRVAPGLGPTRGSTKRYGNMLGGDAADAGLNFLSAEANDAYEERVGATSVGVDAWRTTRNLLASQPLAFNVFGHLSRHLDLATDLFQSMTGEDVVAEVTSIEIERLSDALGDRTAFDAFVTYRRPDGSPACVAIEVKYSEPFSQQAYDWTPYLDHDSFDRQLWRTDDPTVLGDRRWSQLWRNHLLARAEAARLDLGEPLLVVLQHPLDPHAAHVEDYRNLLHDRARVWPLTLSALSMSLHAVAGEPHRQWLSDLDDRYLNLGSSEPLRALSDMRL